MEQRCWCRRLGWWGQTAESKHQDDDVPRIAECGPGVEVKKNRGQSKALNWHMVKKSQSPGRRWACNVADQNVQTTLVGCVGSFEVQHRKCQMILILKQPRISMSILKVWSMVSVDHNSEMLVKSAYLQPWLGGSLGQDVALYAKSVMAWFLVRANNLGWGSDPWWSACRMQPINVSLSHWCSLSPLLSF